MKEKTLKIESEGIIMQIDNTTNFLDLHIIFSEENLGYTGSTIQIDVEQNTIRVDNITLSNTQSQVLKQFINQLK